MASAVGDPTVRARSHVWPQDELTPREARDAERLLRVPLPLVFTATHPQTRDIDVPPSAAQSEEALAEFLKSAQEANRYAPASDQHVVFVISQLSNYGSD